MDALRLSARSWALPPNFTHGLGMRCLDLGSQSCDFDTSSWMPILILNDYNDFPPVFISHLDRTLVIPSTRLHRRVPIATWQTSPNEESVIKQHERPSYQSQDFRTEAL